MVKLEIIRSLMFDTEVIVIDLKMNMKRLRTHWERIHPFSLWSGNQGKPFDLALLHQDADTQEESELNQKILSLHGFFRVVMGKLTPTKMRF